MSGKKGKLRHLHIEPNDDGTAQVKAHRDPMPSEKGNSPMDYGSSDESLGAGSPEEAGAHVTRLLKEHFGKSKSGDDYSDHPLRKGKAFGRGK